MARPAITAAVPETRAVDVSVIVVNFNGREITPACLETVPPGAQLIVVDNGSKDGSPDEIAARFPAAILVRNGVNRGFAAAVNQGLARSNGRYFCLLNNDARLAPDALRTMADFMDAHPDVGMAAPQLLHEDGRRQHSFANLPSLATELLNKSLLRLLFPGRFPSKRQEQAEPVEVESVIGACMMVRRDLIERIGPLDEAYFLFLEETDWCLRARRAGSRVMLVPAARVVHLQGRTRAKVATRARIEYVRSLFTYFRRNRPASYPALRALFPLKCLLELVFQTLGAPFSPGARRRWIETAATLGWQVCGGPRGWGLSTASDPVYVKTVEGVLVAADRLEVLRELERAIPKAPVLKDLRHKKTVLCTLGDRRFFVKIYKSGTGWRRMKISVLGSKAAREHRVGLELRRLGVPTVPIVATKDRGDERWVAVEELKGGAILQETLLSPATEPRRRRRLLHAYGRFARRVQDAGVWQYDFNPSNVLVGEEDDLRIIDFERMEVRGRPLPARVRFPLLAMMNRLAGPSRADRLRFLKGYLGAYPEEGRALRSILAELARLGRLQSEHDVDRSERRCLDDNRDFGPFALGSVRGHYRKRRSESAVPGLSPEELKRLAEGDGAGYRIAPVEDALAEWKRANRDAKAGGTAVPLAVLTREGERGGRLVFRS